ncbi:hypothetical protein A2954_04075 [Candidatus Roizmanbacteria bacterium RIFCSPLOWO2_01_FULL_37_12]|uniref:Aminotransferase class I/classII large domain-containing protein n=1 Tax=Candidatus Roizmanbacteria bacterium RIFCSPLOWO2_01_FULL_37_12 TaxID=1802056 RepID=A0A1F7IFM7_9BACT|nr:MAG: hypothetical protein A3D76_03735 [Candidatus Roizmanbacteria bacterium RIFCSPHIGHO2_02_FULL_37_9b]OGK42164.1 MAG: hypothetical protein A2954_04075 [Candidatus Roizmanbacteria bacterium RIFCSPLOWO2_01_FULL_37_12]
MKFPLIQEDEIFKLKAEFESDRRQHKINGGIGVYLENKGTPYILPTVKKTANRLKFNNFNYLPLSGDPAFLEQTAKLALGNSLFKENNRYIAKQGTIGGTNAIYMWARFIKEVDKKPKIIIANPTWENHIRMFEYFGFSVIRYPHFTKEKQFNFAALKEILLKNPEAYVLYQGGPTHNPSGINPDNNQWKVLAEISSEKKQSILFDYAYLGLGNDIVSDSFCIRHFIGKRIPTSFAVSYSKNMTLYQHRTGALFITLNSNQEKEIAEKILQNTFRLVNSNPAAFGEQIVKTILSSKELSDNWKIDLSYMLADLNKRRGIFIKESAGKFDFLKECRGLFGMLFLTPGQISRLREKYAIYILSNSRINFGGISIKNIAKVAKAVLKLKLT